MSLGRSLDGSLSMGEEIRFKQRYKELMIKLSKQTHFTYPEIENLSVIYYKLQKISGSKTKPISQSVMKDVLHNAFDLTDFEMTPYIICYFQTSPTRLVSLDLWIRMMNIFLKGTFEEKISYCFGVYKGVGLQEKIPRKTLLYLLRNCIFKDNNELDDEAVKDMVDMLLKRMDFDRDGKLSFEDFHQTVMENPVFLETFGQVLPSRLATYAFKLTTLKNVTKM